MEYASKSVGNAGLATGIIGTTLGVLGGGMSLLNNGNACQFAAGRELYDTQMKLIEAERNSAILAADLNSEKKMVEVYNSLQKQINDLEKRIEGHASAQAVYNATNSTTVGIINNQVNQLMSLTKMFIPSSNITPEPMNRYNNWVAPTATDTPAAPTT